MHAEHDIVVANLSCLSVCHTLVLYRNECTYVKRFPPSGRGMTSFLEACHAYRIPRVTLSAGGITYAEVGKICNFYCATHICIVWSLLLKDGYGFVIPHYGCEILTGRRACHSGGFLRHRMWCTVYCWHCCKSCGSVPWVAWKFLALLQSFSWMLIIIIIKHLLSSCQLHHVTQYRESWNITIHNIKTTHMKLYSIHKYKYTSLRKVLTLFHTYYSMVLSTYWLIHSNGLSLPFLTVIYK